MYWELMVFINPTFYRDLNVSLHCPHVCTFPPCYVFADFVQSDHWEWLKQQGSLMLATQPLCLKFCLATTEDAETVIRSSSHPISKSTQKAWSGNVGTEPGLVWNALAPEFPSHPLLGLGTLSLSRGQVNSGQPSVLSPHRSPSFCFSKPGKDSSFSGVHLPWVETTNIKFTKWGERPERKEDATS